MRRRLELEAEARRKEEGKMQDLLAASGLGSSKQLETLRTMGTFKGECGAKVFRLACLTMDRPQVLCESKCSVLEQQKTR